jgi:hypothetical protein
MVSLRKIGLRGSLLVVALLLFQSVKGQYFEFNWSEETKYSNGKNGFFSGYINANSSYMYVLNSNYAATSINNFNKVKLVAYNKFTMTEEASIPLKGFPENKAAKEQFETLRYYKTVVLEDRIIVFWTKLINTDSVKTEELYAETFKVDLERESGIKKVYSISQTFDVQQSEFARPSFVILSNLETSQLIIGSELHNADSNLVFEYAKLNNRMEVSMTNRITLPEKSGEVQNGVVSGYELGRDGNIYIRSSVALSRDEIRLLKPTDAKSYLVLTILNPATKQKGSIEMRGANKTITDFSFVVSDTTVRVVGFFGDLEKDPTGIDKQGIFYANLKSDSLYNAPLNYSYFERTSLKKLFPKSKGGRKKKVENPTEEELNTRFDIENIFSMEDGSIVMFFTRKYNYTEITSRSGMDGKNIYKTDYFCEKNNVSAIRFTADGKITWTGNIERTKTYEGTDVADVRVIYKFNKFYVMYGTEPVKKQKKRKKGPELREVLEYATFDPVTGKGKILELEVNPDKTPKDEKKAVDPNSIVVYDGRFYHSQMTLKQKPEWIAANIVLFPSIYYSVLSGNTKYAKGRLGVITLMDGKPPKKR